MEKYYRVFKGNILDNVYPSKGAAEARKFTLKKQGEKVKINSFTAKKKTLNAGSKVKLKNNPSVKGKVTKSQFDPFSNEWYYIVVVNGNNLRGMVKQSDLRKA